MAKGLVYILTNPCLDGWVKIGMISNNLGDAVGRGRINLSKCVKKCTGDGWLPSVASNPLADGLHLWR